MRTRCAAIVSAIIAASCGQEAARVTSEAGAAPTPTDECASADACVLPPSVPDATTPPRPVAHDYAVTRLFAGDTDRSGNPSPTAWQAYGYNLDGLVTTATSTDVCTRLAGAASQVQVDGEGGIDNSFGANLMPIILQNEAMEGCPVGVCPDNTIMGTELFYVVGFDDTAGNTTSARGLTGVALAGGSQLDEVPVGLSTHWPILPSSLDCPSAGCPAGTDPVASALVKFPHAFQSGGTFVSGARGVDLALDLSIGGEALPVTLHSTIITFQPQAPGSVTEGTIAGVLRTTELVEALREAAGAISASLCYGSAFDSIEQQVEQGSDIVLDVADTVSNAPGQPCSAISIGLGFDAAEIAPPASSDILPAAPAMPEPCADAGP